MKGQETEMNERLRLMRSAYLRLMSAGIGLILIAFAFVVFRFAGRLSLWIAIPLFLAALVPLEMARRVARKMALLVARETGP